MTDLFNEMKVFDPVKTIRDIEYTAKLSGIMVTLFVDDGETEREEARIILHGLFQEWLEHNGYFEREEVMNWANHKGEHVQTVSQEQIDYVTYLMHYICEQDIYDYLVHMGETYRYEPTT